MKTNDLLALLPTRAEMERAFASKDAGYDGVFYVAVKTTGIFCRPSCPSRPNLENVEFFLSVKDCLFAGYRPCKRCQPLEANGTPPDWARELISRVEAAPDARLKAADLRALGIPPERARRWFQQHHGMNCVAILIPCHRVIGKDGGLTGYGGGLLRKRLLLELERTGRLPGRDDNSANRASDKANSCDRGRRGPIKGALAEAPGFGQPSPAGAWRNRR